MIETEQVLGNTGCLFAGGNCIPFYRLEPRRWILLDSGSHVIRQELHRYLQQNQIQICAVLCSHAHFDHIENNRFLQETYGTEVIMTAMDAGIAHNTAALKSCFYSHTPEDNEQYYHEMLCRADRIIAPQQQEIEVEGVVFSRLWLPGHAASHLGFVTPDGAAYLADSVFSPDHSGKERLIYMLNWKQALETMEKLQYTDEGKNYILAHGGVYSDVRPVARENLQRFTQILEGFFGLFSQEGCSMDELVRRSARRYHFLSEDFDKASLFERIVRAMAEYWIEMGKVKRSIRDGVVLYGKNEQ